jgi:hypothetical protein
MCDSGGGDNGCRMLGMCQVLTFYVGCFIVVRTFTVGDVKTNNCK